MIKYYIVIIFDIGKDGKICFYKVGVVFLQNEGVKFFMIIQFFVNLVNGEFVFFEFKFDSDDVQVIE